MQAQNQQPEMSADRSAAALAFATMLSEQQMPKVAPEQPQEAPTSPQEAPVAPENAPVEEIAPEPVEEPVEEPKEEPEENKEIENLTNDFNEFKGKIEGIIETKFNDLTKALKDAIRD